MKLKKQTITDTIPALVYFVHSVRLSTLQQPCEFLYSCSYLKKFLSVVVFY
jgi:imidazoleglycerol phosphate synthase glutamine amidotransferase subunit HisH